MNLAEAWDWLRNHPKLCTSDGLFYGIEHNLDIDVVLVNPDTEEIDPDDTKNTAVRIWLEMAPAVYLCDLPEASEHPDWGRTLCGSHDIELDCGGASFEEAIMELVGLVKQHYGDYDPEQGADSLLPDVDDAFAIFAEMRAQGDCAR